MVTNDEDGEKSFCDIRCGVGYNGLAQDDDPRGWQGIAMSNSISIPNTVELNEENFDAEVLRSPVPVLVIFAAEYRLAVSDLIRKLVRDAAERYGGRLRIGIVGLDSHLALAQRFGIDSGITFLIFRDGKLVDSAHGVMAEQAVFEMLDRNV
ncbi:MAG: thioredoxin [Phycisphaerales bacterium]|nr:thioredoxin [Phycisphaerales bacterium]